MADLIDLIEKVLDEDLVAPSLFPIEDGIPIPEDRSIMQRIKWDAHLYPFDRMTVGQSFVARRPAGAEGIDIIRVQNSVTGAASSYCQKWREKNPDAPEKKFTTRQIGGRFVRCWRSE